MHIQSYTNSLHLIVFYNTQPFPHFDLFTCFSDKLKVFGSFKHKNDGAAQLESSHLLASGQGLTSQEC